jgi:hypothetical protein
MVRPQILCQSAGDRLAGAWVILVMVRPAGWRSNLRERGLTSEERGFLILRTHDNPGAARYPER